MVFSLFQTAVRVILLDFKAEKEEIQALGYKEKCLFHLLYFA